MLNAVSGYPFAGLPRIVAIRDAKERTRPTQALRVLRETPVSLQIDGGNQVGYVALTKGIDLALNKVRQSGVCILAMGNTWYTGRSFNYVERLAREGYAALLFSGGPPLVAPHGAIKPMLGTNPICVAFPTAPDPVIVDLGTSATMSGEVLLHALLNKPMPAEVGIGPDGTPTRDASQILKGAILPLAGHKGYALSFAVQALSLFGAAVLPPALQDGVGHLLIAFDPTLLCAREEFDQGMAGLRERITSLPRASGVQSVDIPSDRTYRSRQTLRAQGIDIDDAIVAQLKAMSRQAST